MAPSASPRVFTLVTKVWLKCNEANGGDRRSNITFFPSGKISEVALDAGFAGITEKELAALPTAVHLPPGSEWRPGPLSSFRPGKPMRWATIC